MGKTIEIGARVAYSVPWLRSVDMVHTDTAHDRGTVREISEFGATKLARVDWDGDSPERVNVANLARVGGRGFCAD
jgi:hypothetical protein